MKEVTNMEKEFYILLYDFYDKLRKSKGYFNPIRAAHHTLSFLDKHKDSLHEIDKTDIRNLLLLTRILLEEEHKHNTGKILRSSLRTEEIIEYIDSLSYLAK